VNQEGYVDNLTSTISTLADLEYSLFRSDGVYYITGDNFSAMIDAAIVDSETLSFYTPCPDVANSTENLKKSE